MAKGCALETVSDIREEVRCFLMAANCMLTTLPQPCFGSFGEMVTSFLDEATADERGAQILAGRLGLLDGRGAQRQALLLRGPPHRRGQRGRTGGHALPVLGRVGQPCSARRPPPVLPYGPELPEPSARERRAQHVLLRPRVPAGIHGQLAGARQPRPCPACRYDGASRPGLQHPRDAARGRFPQDGHGPSHRAWNA